MASLTPAKAAKQGVQSMRALDERIEQAKAILLAAIQDGLDEWDRLADEVPMSSAENDIVDSLWGKAEGLRRSIASAVIVSPYD